MILWKCDKSILFFYKELIYISKIKFVIISSLTVEKRKKLENR